ncbi:MAG: arsenate reductase ArsC [Burkholderiales bacterium]|nr:arsenate reductase ArsC [Burkholderiales bacterium]
MSQDAPRNVLFLCTGNSARSILAEALLAGMGKGRFRAFSAGSHPAGQVNPLAIEILQKNRLATEGLRSKSWEEFMSPPTGLRPLPPGGQPSWGGPARAEFSRPDAPVLDFVFTVCDNAAGEVCPVWPGQPVTAHWGVDDPAAVDGDDATRRRAFLNAYTILRTRIQLFINLPLASLDRLALAQRLSDIGRT